MRALLVTPECYPLVKTGGLADVTGALPLALAAHGVDARVLLPGYPAVLAALPAAREVADLGTLHGGPARVVGATTVNGLVVFVLDAPHLYDRPGGIYLGADGRDWPDNDIRFAALCLAGARIAVGEVGDFAPDVVHVHDWQAGLVPAYLRLGVVAPPAKRATPPTLLTIHNLAFKGLFPADHLDALDLPVASFDVDGVEYFDQISFLKAAVRYADRVSTVSPTYAREIVTPELGMGFDGVLRQANGPVVGIVNGIDDDVWNPWTDSLVPHPYGPRQMRGKADDKAALQAELGLDARPDAPLFCVISRLTEQKGLDLLLAVLDRLLAAGAQLAVLGSGDASLEAGFGEAAVARPGSVATVIGYDEALSHRLQAGSDVIVVPSRFEPCGLTQLYGLRYGTLPLVSRVGGLADTVIDANAAAVADGVATGFVFAPVDADALATAIERAAELYRQPATWRLLRRRAMSREVGWERAAASYHELYQSMLDDARGKDDA